jgi:hypothetical protein
MKKNLKMHLILSTKISYNIKKYKKFLMTNQNYQKRYKRIINLIMILKMINKLQMFYIKWILKICKLIWK